MTRIHNKEVNKIPEWDLLHDMISPPKRAKTFNRHYSPILHGCMNIRVGRARFKNFQIWLVSGCRSTILMGRIFEKYVLGNFLWCSGTHWLEISLLILRLNNILPCLNLAQKISWCGNVMWMNFLKVDMIWS